MLLLVSLLIKLKRSDYPKKNKQYFLNFYSKTATISAVTDKIVAKVKEWQTRPLEPLYPFERLDVIHYKIKDGGEYVLKAVYTILSVRLDGKKEVLRLYLSENEGAANF